MTSSAVKAVFDTFTFLTWASARPAPRLITRARLNEPAVIARTKVVITSFLLRIGFGSTDRSGVRRWPARPGEWFARIRAAGRGPCRYGHAWRNASGPRRRRRPIERAADVP